MKNSKKCLIYMSYRVEISREHSLKNKKIER